MIRKAPDSGRRPYGNAHLRKVDGLGLANLTTAKALGRDVRPGLVVRADEVTEWGRADAVS
jgi:hypothetical protein